VVCLAQLQASLVFLLLVLSVLLPCCKMQTCIRLFRLRIKIKRAETFGENIFLG
jgi:hypothetical protein